MTKEFKILVCGGRDYDNYEKVKEILDDAVVKLYHPIKNKITIIHGGARGADSLADRYSEEHDIDKEVYEADWENEGRSAGPKRNQRMLDEGKPDCVVAFPGGRGTQHMVNIARKKGVPVYEIK